MNGPAGSELSEAAESDPQPRLLPPLELEVMKVLWTEGESSVAEVQLGLNSFKPLAYTTVMTLLDRLTRKSAVSRRKQGRGFRYTPVFTREAVLDLAVERLVEDFFDNSRHELAAYLGAEPIASPALAPQVAPPLTALQEEQQESIDSVLL